MRPRNYRTISYLGWTLTILLLIVSNINHERQEFRTLVINTARAFALNSARIRNLNVGVGGFYAFTDTEISPSPYLGHLQDRNLRTADGRTLTLVNVPAMFDLLNATAISDGDRSNFSVRIKSLDSFMPNMAPDDWERSALLALRDGQKECADFCKLSDNKYFRYMLPLYADELCLKSRSDPNLKLGDLVSGLSVTVPLSYFEWSGEKYIIIEHLLIWLVGLAGIFWSFNRINREILAKINAESSGRSLQMRYDLVLDSAGEGIIGLDTEGRHIFINPAASAMLGFSEDELIGKESHPIYHQSTPDGGFYPREKCPFVASYRKGETRRNDNEFFQRKDGSYFQISYTSQPMREDGSLLGAVITFTDISELHENRKILRDQQKRLDVIFNQAAVGMAQLDRDNKWLTVNDKLCEMTGYSRAELTNMAYFDLIHPEDIGDNTIPGEKRFISKNGSIRAVFISANSIKSEEPGENHLILTVEDITERKLHEEQQKELQHQLFQAQKMETIGQLAGGVAHDFNNLLSVILSYTDFALGQAPDDSPMIDDLEEVKKAGSRGAELTRQLLAFSRKQNLEKRPIDLNNLVENISKMLNRLIGETITLELKTIEPIGTICGDPGQLEQVLMNLAVNARDAMPDGGRIAIEIMNVEIGEDYRRKHREIEPGSYTALIFRDSGSGIPAEIREKVFDPFFTTKGEGEGTGLGLSTVYGIVKQHGGHINIESETGKGTTFRILLPVAENNCKVQEDTKDKEFETLTGDETILLIEDDRQLLAALERGLTEFGYRVFAAHDTDSAEAILKDRNLSIDLIITDIIIPGKRSRTLVEESLAAHPGLKTIYMSGYAENVIESKGVEITEVNFISKPIKLMELLLKIRQSCEPTNP